MKNSYLKKSLSIIMTVCMLLSCWVFVEPHDHDHAHAAVQESGRVALVAPETIYLAPNAQSWKEATTSTFQYYVNNTMHESDWFSNNPTPSTTATTSGTIYFAAEKAIASTEANVKLSYNFLDSTGAILSGGSVSSAAPVYDSTKKLWSISITGGTSPSLAAATTGCFVMWIVEYTTKDGERLAASAFSGVYKPYVVPVGGAVRVVAERSGDDAYAQHLAWISGVHSIKAGSNTDGNGNSVSGYSIKAPNFLLSSSGKGMLGFLGKSNSAMMNNSTAVSGFKGVQGDMYAVFASTTAANSYFWAGQSGSSVSGNGSSDWLGGGTTFGINSFGYYTTSGNPSSNHRVGLVYPSASGNITIDTSRYTNLNQIPNLGVGLIATDTDNSEKGSWYIADFSDGGEYEKTTDYFQRNESDSTRYFPDHGTLLGSQIASTSSVKDSMSGDYDSTGLKYSGSWNRETKSDGKYSIKSFLGTTVNGKTYAHSYTFIDMNATQVNKSALRTAVYDAIREMGNLGLKAPVVGSTLYGSQYYDTTSAAWTNFWKHFRCASSALGQVDYTDATGAYGTIESIINNLNSAVAALKAGKNRIIYFDVNHDGINPNLYIPDTTPATVNSVSLSYDAATQIFTFNGTPTTDAHFGYTPFAATVGDHTFKTHHISGSKSTGGCGVYEVYTYDKNQHVSRKDLNIYEQGDNINTPVTFNYTEAGTSAFSHLWCWSDSGALSFDNYKFKIKIEKGKKATEYSPVAQIATADGTYGSLPSGVTRGGYTFGGWATSADSKTAISANSAVTSDTLYAIWNPITYTITYDANGGTIGNSSLSFTAETELTFPEATRTGYTFDGWMINSTEGTLGQYNGGVVNANQNYGTGWYGNATLVAQWTINQYTVTFVDKNGATLKTETVSHGGSATAPTVPDIDASENGVCYYKFSSWDKAFNNVTGNLTVTAQYTSVEHAAGTPVTENPKAPTCGAAGSHDVVTYCTECNTELSRETVTDAATGNHNYTSVVTAPTCTTEGYTTYTCTVCSHSYKDNYKDALDHDWTEITYTWADDYKTCTAARTCKRNGCSVSETATAEITSTVKEAATCTVKGWTTYTATFTETWAKTQTEDVQDIALKDHIPGEAKTENVTAPTCTVDGSHDEVVYCTACNEKLSSNTVVDKALGHLDANKDHVCDRGCGAAQGTCSDSETDNDHVCDYGCGKVLEDCSDADNDGDHKCDICDADNVTAHIKGGETRENITEATCGSAGKYDSVYYCTECNTVMERINDVTIDKLPHNWQNPTYTWTADGKSCTVTRVCANNAEHTESETVNTTGVQKTAPTCENKGTTTYTATFDATWATAQTKDVEDIPAKNHAWSVEYSWAEDGKSCTATRKCANDAAHNVTATAKITSEVKTAATCEDMGTTTYTATFEGVAWATEQTKDVEDIPAKNHAWSVEYSWAEDGKSCTATHVCANDADHNETATAKITSEVKTAATCEDMGTTTYTATFSEAWATEQTKDVEDIPAKNHAWSVEYSWAEDGKSCTATRKCANDAAHNVTATAKITSEVKTAATCEGKGTTTYTATFSEAWATEQTKDVEDIPAKNHAWSVEYSWAEDGKTCTATHVCANDAKHNVTSEATVNGVVTTPATCTEMGTTTYTAEFSADWADTQTKEVVDVNALGHNFTGIAANAATCTEDGNEAYKYCETCKLYFAADAQTDSTGGLADNKSFILEATGHDYKSEVTAPTCEDKGFTTHTCSICGDSYVDTYVDATDHDWGNWTFVADGQHKRVCANDSSHTETENCADVDTDNDCLCDKCGNLVAHKYGEATCEAPATCTVCGETTGEELGHSFTNYVSDGNATCTADGTKTAKCDRCDVEDTVADEGSKLGHDWDTVTYNFAANGSTCTAERVCKRTDCGATETATAAIASAVKTPATCTEKGWTTYTATFTETWAKEQTLDVDDINALNHAWGEATYDFAADGSACTATRECTRADCGATETATAEITSAEKIAPTCTEMGTTTYTATFTVDWAETKTKDVKDVDALDHDWKATTYTWADDGKSCTAERVCQRTDCGETETATAEITSAEKIAPTCTEMGTTTYTATFTVDWAETKTKDVKDVDALDHDWKATTYTWADDGKSCTAERVCKRTDCGTTETATAEITSEVTTPATCTEKGTTTYTATFTVDWAETKTKDVKDVDALDRNETTYTFAADGSTCTATRECSNSDEHTESVTVECTSEITTPATCEGMGTTTYTAEFNVGWAATQTTTREDVAAINHSWTVEYNWSEDGKTCTATRKCTRTDCGETETATAEITSAVKTPATCTEKGTTTYTATFSEAWATEQTKDVKDISALNHDWKATTYTWADDGKSCTAERVCQRTDCGETETATAEITSEVTIPATCTEKGTTTYTATFTETWAKEQTLDVDDINALNHAWGEATYDFAADGSACTATRECTRTDCGTTETATAEITSEVTTPATCTEKGTTTYTATFDVTWAETKTKDVKDVDALDHDWKATTYTWAEDGKSCTAERVCQRKDCGETETATAEITSAEKIAPTCTEMGTTTYTATFTVDWAETKTKDVKDISALNHDWKATTYTWADDGKSCTAERVCQRKDCGATETATAEITSEVTIPATCTEKGTTTYTATFDVTWAETKTKDVKDVDALDHDWKATTYTWAEDGKSCTAERVCQRKDCGETETATAEITSAEKIAPSCTEMGTTTYTATFTVDWAETKTKDVKDVDALDHDWKATTYTWADDGKSCTATRECQRTDCGATETATAEITSEVTTPATCTEKGTTTYTATFDVTWAETKTKDVKDISALNHDWKATTYTWADDGKSCTAERVCQRTDCGATETATAEITSEVTTPATCTEMGTTTYTATFTVDWAETKTKDVKDIPETGHSYASVVTPPTCTEDGYTTHTCSDCGDSYVNAPVDNLGHDFSVEVNSTVGNCLEVGTTTFKCSRCEETKTVDGALGMHSWKATTYTFSADGSTCTATRECSNSDEHTESVTVECTSEITTPATCEGMGTTTYTAEFNVGWAATQTTTREDVAAINHDWSVEYNWSEDGKTCTATHVCANDAKHNETSEATVNGVVTTPATCEGMGTTTYTATFAADWAATQTTTREDVAAINHDWSVEYNWSEDGKTCTATHVCANDAKHNETSEATVNGVVTTPATCTEMGTTTYTATFAADWAETQTTTRVDVAAINHSWTVEYNWAEDGKTCTATHVCANDAKHNVTIDATITSKVKTAATCEDMGTTTYTATFSEAWATEQTKDVVDIPAINHSWTVEYNWSADGKTCTATRVCGNDAKHNVTSEATVNGVVTTPATCEGMGTTTYTATFAADWAETQTTTREDVAAINHSWTVEYNWSEDGKSCTATRVCANDAKHNVTSEATVNGVVTTPATCTEKGTTTYTATFAADWAATQTTTREDVAAINHAWTVEYNWSEDGKTCTATRVCANDAKHNVTSEATVNGVVTTPATCTEKGTTTYTAKFSADWAETQTTTREDVSAINHSWTVTYNWSEDGKTCTATRVCGNDAKHNVTSEATVNGVVTTPATCTEKGTTTYTATFAADWAETQTTTREDVAAINHSWTVEYNWSADGKTCTATRVCGNDAKHNVTSEATVNGVVTTPATCTEKGITTYTATFTADWAETQTTTREDVAAINHSWTVTYSWSDDGKTCTATRVCANDAKHNVTAEATVEGVVTTPATCEGKGTTTYTAEFTADWAETQTTTREDVAAINHSWTVEYNWSEDGKTCTATRVCANDAKHNVTSEATVNGVVTTPPTCTEKGTTTYTAEFNVGWAETQTTTREDVAAINHSWTVEYNWSADGKTCTATRVCGNDAKHNVTSEATVNGVVTTPATCTEKGTTTYTATFAADWAATQTTTREDVAAINHSWTVEYNWSEDGKTCTATRVCANDAKHNETSEATVNGVVTTPATCEGMGTTTYTATFAADWAETQTTTREDVAALNHKDTLVQVAAQAATCTEIGWEAYEYCTACDYTTYEEIDALGHDIVVDEAVAPDCVNTGLTAGSHCSRCDEMTVEQETVAALDHDFSVFVASTAGNCQEVGTTTYKCSRCDETTVVNGAYGGHTEKAAAKENEVAPTCTSEGSYDMVVRCALCNEAISTESFTVEMLDHEFTEFVSSTAGNCQEVGTTTYKCEHCDATEVREGSIGGHIKDVRRINEIKATCTKNGYYDRVEYCTVCDEVFSIKPIITNMADHTAAAAVRENEISATENENGSYEEVLYCEHCGEELSRKTVVIPATGSDSDDDSDLNTGSGIKCSWWERFIAWLYKIFATIKQLFTGIG